MEHFTFHICNSGIEEDVQFSGTETEEIFLPLLRNLTRLQKEKRKRIIVFLAAPPGAGKSTFVQYLEYLSEKDPGLTPVTGIGMDGFHRYQSYLLTHSLNRDGREVRMVDVKGCPETFDLPLLAERLKMAASGAECGWPSYDRLLHNPVENALLVKGDIVLLEGNYLLLDRDGWRDLKQYADYTIRIMAEEDLLRGRLIRRKISTGVSQKEAEAFVEFSDLYNARTCLKYTMAADLNLCVRESGFYLQSSENSANAVNTAIIEQSTTVPNCSNIKFRRIRPEDAVRAAEIEAICFPPEEACTLPIMRQRIEAAGDCFLAAVDSDADSEADSEADSGRNFKAGFVDDFGKMIGFINGLCTDDLTLQDEIFTDIRLHDSDGANIMICSVAVLPEYRGRGIARTMMAEFLKRQKNLGRKQAILTCVPGKVSMYRKFGFIDNGLSQSAWGGEVWHEMYCMLQGEN